MKKVLCVLLAVLMAATLLTACGGKTPAGEDKVEHSDLYEQVMARFTGELEQGAVVKVLEKDVTLLLHGDSLVKVTKHATRERQQAISLFRVVRSSCIGDNRVKIC